MTFKTRSLDSKQKTIIKDILDIFMNVKEDY